MFGVEKRSLELGVQSKSVGENEEGNLLVAAKKRMVLGCPMQLASEMKPHTPLTDQKTNEILKYGVEREIM